jgi:hypothetical protein
VAIDQTAREANIRDSIKKHCIDNLYTIEKIQLTFDKKLTTPDLTDKSIDKWISINFGRMIPLNISSMDLSVYLCTRKDAEGMKLAKLNDTFLDYFTDNTTSDGIKRIKMYRMPPGVSPIEVTETTILVMGIESGSQMEAADGTNYRLLTVNLKWVAKI